MGTLVHVPGETVETIGTMGTSESSETFEHILNAFVNLYFYSNGGLRDKQVWPTDTELYLEVW